MSSGSKGNREQGIALRARAAVADSHWTLPWVDTRAGRLRTIARLEAEVCVVSNHVGCVSPFLAQSGHASERLSRQVSGLKRTLACIRKCSFATLQRQRSKA
jgi:hypothetical protein